MDKSFLKTGGSQALVELVRRLISEVNTSIPGQIVTFDASKQTATVRPCIRSVTIDQAGEKTFVTLPEIFLCPVWFPYSTTSGFCVTYPINPEDQCLIIFSQRSFDKWLVYGSYQNPTEEGIPRTHALTDAVALVGLIPNVNLIPNFQMDGIEIRNQDRKSYTKIANAKIEQKTLTFDATYSVLEKAKSEKRETEVVTDSSDKIGGNSIREITGNETKTVGGNDTETIIGEKKIEATKVTLQPVTSIEGQLFTGIAPGGATQQGLTTSVTVDGKTLTFVNGILVNVS